ncbi:CDP-alcohol phosphatidyltransferase-like enzyme [Melghirimyces profundicolus]|uniref:CDP-alcohol phosphatidyltransferase-like enzyme n=1 Tax=Melghirimyces profundicolus TaxID=1242148 RepID=A0A2T6B3I7_9BACL|nr:CDP-alcohol phosphatidyltransferase family protein [Melghirimyces profundicolus]PTX50636.1 CDP-alcohol phosphatidyltransferase-like enzyme [Melghirimyces profundicolus]
MTGSMKKGSTTEKLPTLPVDSEKIRTYRSLCQKPRQLEEIWSWYVLRRISIYLTVGLGRTRVTPNGISWSSLLFFAMTGWFLIPGEAWGYFLAFLFYNLGYLGDCMDGELARLKKVTSRLGVYLDTLIRAMSIPILAGVSLGLLRQTGWAPIGLAASSLIYGAVLVGTLALLVPLSYNYVGLKTDENDPVSEMRTSSPLMEWVAFFTGLPGFFAFLFIFTGVEFLSGASVVPLLLIVFLTVMTVKTLIRLYLTTQKLI